MPYHKISVENRQNARGTTDITVICDQCGVIDKTMNKHHAQMLVGKHHRQFNKEK